ncbi:MAG TPA: class I SAM-dependent methyltransferase [Thermodesulfobacteriota bacterium]|nr:class I SAM-dependent methyltransferase [Thermodesulfobacteriota bacterium]
MAETELKKEYALSDTENEKKRLEQQSRIIIETTRRIFELAGIVRGMRVLELGTGAGDVALLLAQMVGHEGEVVSIERNPEILETAKKRAAQMGYGNIRFVNGDISAAEPEGVFDALAGRAVLMYVPRPVEVLKALVRHVKPGGIVVFQEVDFTVRPVSIPAYPLFMKCWGWLYAAMEKAGTEMQMGFKLLPVFRAAGLPEPVMHMDAFVGGAASAGLDWFVSTIRSLVPMMVKHGVASAEEVGIDTLRERIIAEAAGSDALDWVGMSNTWISAWTRKP